MFNAIQSLRPIFGSAVSFWLSTLILHPFAIWLDPSFSFFLTRGIGKIAIMVAAIMQLICFLAICPQAFARRICRTALFWPFSRKDLILFGKALIVLALFHMVVIGSYGIFGAAALNMSALSAIYSRWPLFIVGFIGTFFLAYSEELIFRGLLFQHFSRSLSVLPSAFLSSAIFSLLHDLHNPLNLITTQSQLGLGLFLLGMFLTMVSLSCNSLGASSGAHAGLVYIKVLLRKIPLITVIPGSTLWFPVDLRESLLIHILLIIGTWILYDKIKKDC